MFLAALVKLAWPWGGATGGLRDSPVNRDSQSPGDVHFLIWGRGGFRGSSLLWDIQGLSPIPANSVPMLSLLFWKLG